jgi:hypothetical protein
VLSGWEDLDLVDKWVPSELSCMVYRYKLMIKSDRFLDRSERESLL